MSRSFERYQGGPRAGPIKASRFGAQGLDGFSSSLEATPPSPAYAGVIELEAVRVPAWQGGKVVNREERCRSSSSRGLLYGARCVRLLCVDRLCLERDSEVVEIPLESLEGTSPWKDTLWWHSVQMFSRTGSRRNPGHDSHIEQS